MRIDATHANDLRESKRGRRGWVSKRLQDIDIEIDIDIEDFGLG